MTPQLMPEHEIECLSSPQVKLLYEYMKEDQIIDPVKLDLCEYQAIEPVHSYHLVRECYKPQVLVLWSCDIMYNK